MKEKNKSSNHDDQLNELLKEIDEEIQDFTITPGEPTEEVEGQRIEISSLFSFVIPLDHSKVWLQYTPNSSRFETPIKAIEILNQITQQKIVYGVNEKNIQKSLRIAKEHPNIPFSLMIAEGRHPIPPKSPRVKYWIGQEPGFQNSEVIFARKNDLLLKISPASPGLPGIDVFGEEILPKTITKSPIQAGTNVIQEPAGEFYAALAGTVYLKDDVLWIEAQSRDASFSISVSNDEMEVSLSIEPALGKGRPISYEEVWEALMENNITLGILDQNIRFAIDASKQSDKPIKNRLIAQGKVNTIGTDEIVQWNINPLSQSNPFTLTEDGNVDFYNLNNIVTVRKGDCIVSVTPPTAGENGYTVRGKQKEGLLGKKSGIRAGDNIGKKSDGIQWFAQKDGFLFFINNEVSVRSVLTINSDVDFSTGNIDFLGDVYITGSVLDEFCVKATGNIIIQGSVEAAFLEAGQSIYIQQGVFGKEKGQLQATEDIVATFFQNAVIEAGRDVIAGNQILNSDIKARRYVLAQSGQGCIVGGEILAGHGITAKRIGSDVGTRTLVEVGLDFQILYLMTEISNKRKKLSQQYKLLTELIEKCKDNTDEKSQLNLKFAQRKQIDLIQILDKLENEYQEYSKDLYTIKDPKITALYTLMPDVYIKIRDARNKVITTYENCVVSYNMDSERIELRKKSFT